MPKKGEKMEQQEAQELRKEEAEAAKKDVLESFEKLISPLAFIGLKLAPMMLESHFIKSDMKERDPERYYGVRASIKVLLKEIDEDLVKIRETLALMV